ncbi:MAG: cadherin-like domain-containing protein, partial [Chloroflexi bacterium]|nr:cadherin-like domain-containing protein [Chloroflexota bacterium]
AVVICSALTSLGSFGAGTVATTSAIEVSGLTGPVTDVDVNLLDITFIGDSTQDIDVLLIGPEGRTALILSDVGGNTTTSSVNLLLDDQASEQLPDSTALKTGAFQPNNVGSPDTMNLGAGPITPPSGASLGTFNGINPNGTWRLWVFDDQPNGMPAAGGGINGGWALRVTTADDEPTNGAPTNGAPTADEPTASAPTAGAPAATGDRFQARAGQALNVTANGVLGNDSDPDGDPLTAIVANQPTRGSLALQADGSFTYKPTKRAKGTDTFTYLAQDPSGLNAEATVDIQIKAAKDKQGKVGKKDNGGKTGKKGNGGKKGKK